MVEDYYPLVKEIKKYAKENKVPIMQEEGIEFLCSYMIKNKVKTVLEVGTAIGFSAIMMALSNKDVKIVTIEKDQERYLEALKNVKKLDLEDRITLIYNDALEVKFKEKFDLIFIDAAKSKNKELFQIFEKNLASNGSIITDNLSLHGNVSKDPSEIQNRNLRQLVNKIKNYIDFLEDNIKYKTTFYDIGDGISISRRRL